MRTITSCPNCGGKVEIALVGLEDEILVCDTCGTDELDWKQIDNFEVLYTKGGTYDFED